MTPQLLDLLVGWSLSWHVSEIGGGGGGGGGGQSGSAVRLLHVSSQEMGLGAASFCWSQMRVPSVNYVLYSISMFRNL